MNKTPEYVRNPLTPQYYLAELARPEEMQVTVSQQDFEMALRELVPSVSEAEMLHYKVVQQRFNPETRQQEQVAVDRKGKGKARAL
jgi:peroxin-6